MGHPVSSSFDLLYWTTFRGLAVANGVGILRSLYCYKDASLHCTPVDTSVRGIIVAAWKDVTIDRYKKSSETTIYNVSNGTTTIREMTDIAATAKFMYPLSFSVWNPCPSYTSSIWYHTLKSFFVHFLAAVVIDSVLPLFSNLNISVLRIQRKIAHAQDSLKFFMTHHWTIETGNYKALTSFINEEDKWVLFGLWALIHYLPNCREAFSVSSDAVKNRIQYIQDQALCSRRYVLKVNSSPRGKKTKSSFQFLGSGWEYSTSNQTNVYPCSFGLHHKRNVPDGSSI